MRAKVKRSVSFGPYVIPMLMLIAAFIATDFLLVRAIRGYFSNMLQTQSINYARIYTHSLTKTKEAYDLINELLEDKLLSASGTTALYSAHMTSESLTGLARLLGVDDIFIYNAEGEIVHSNREEYLGWRAEPGHPVHDFLTSGASAVVEDIRADTESGELYKYGCFRGEEGQFVQLGIKADRVAALLKAFETGYILDELGGLELVDQVYFIDDEFAITASSDPWALGTQVDDPAVVAALAAGEPYAHTRFDQRRAEQFYEVYVPVFTGADYAGALVISMSTEPTRAMVRTASGLAVVAATIGFATFSYVILSHFQHNRELVALAYQDSLSGLPNRAYLMEVLDEALGRGLDRPQAIMMIHCRNIGAINSAYGFDIGDRALLELSRRLQAFVSEQRRLFHFATDWFVLYVTDYAGRDALIDLAQQIQADLERPLECVKRQIVVRTGILELHHALRSAVEALTEVSVALHNVETGQSIHSYGFYDCHIEEQLQREELLVREMSEFIADPRSSVFYLEYQPKVSLVSHRIVGFEALARMNSPSSGRVSPVEFIPIAERQDLIVPLGYFFLEAACKFAKRLADEGYPNLHVGVNISVVQLKQDDFAARVSELVERVGIEPGSLQLEITESVLIEDFDDIYAKLYLLREQGITIALDDFGTGYSALARIEELPIDSIKIDKRFIDNILLDGKPRQILEGLISMCHTLGLEVVAEGVEHEHQRQYLAMSNCDVMQGYLYSRPLPEGEALEMLRPGQE